MGRPRFLCLPPAKGSPPSTGSRTVPVKVYLDGSSNVGVVGEYAISVSLT